MAAGLATMNIISRDGFYEPLFAHTKMICDGMQKAADDAGVPFTTNHAGTMFGGFFTEADAVENYADVMACDTQGFARFFHHMLDSGVYLAPASYEAGFMSAAHTDEDIQESVDAAARAFAAL